MNCIEILKPGGPENLKVTSIPIPLPKKNEVLINYIILYY